jgi:hypothetical protein
VNKLQDARIYVFFILIHLLLKIKGFNWLSQKLNKKKNKVKSIEDVELSQALIICSHIEKVRERHFLKDQAQCLHRSLLGYFLLAESKIDVNLCLGIHKERFEAHAWLEYKDTVINDSDSLIKSKYNVIYRC